MQTKNNPDGSNRASARPSLISGLFPSGSEGDMTTVVEDRKSFATLGEASSIAMEEEEEEEEEANKKEDPAMLLRKLKE